jgi:Type ISP C-terminal specificity domain/N-6 DNA Methylase
MKDTLPRSLQLGASSLKVIPMPNHPLEVYLSGCASTHATGAATDETAYYPALKALLDAAGHALKPHVHCVMGLKNQGMGMPDGGLFTPDQFQKGEGTLRKGQLPSRGVVECKPPKSDVLDIADTKQVSDYWQQNNQVLVTNYREFLLIGRDEKGKPVRYEYYRLADSEKAFWRLAGKPQAALKEHGERLIDFLKRCLRRSAPLTDPKDVAWFLASYARDARLRVEHSKAHKKLVRVRAALEEALGLKVTDAKGEHFFQSTLVQTLFYGIFAAWVLWHRSHRDATEKFDWEKGARYLHVPILRKLFREMTDPEDLDAADNLTEVMNWAADTLNRVVREKFFEKFQDAEAVQYFYEPFLEEFDPEMRKALGVWYTPPEVVKYMVARVDQMLRSDFNKPDGLADPEVFVLDPCCGTGAYLTEVLNTIAATLKDKGEDALLGGKLKKAAKDRIFGFEILPAPFVIAHLQLGLFLQAHGSPLDDKNHERAAVYLTNALTGWQPPTGPKQGLLFPELENERDAADRVKQRTPILVVIGNPPYNGFAGLAETEEKGLVEPYRTTKNAPKPQGQGLNDHYVRFFRVAERCITERQAQHGIVCYISNYSWLDGLSHTGLRERFLDEFDQIWIDSLNGDKYKTGKQTPEGEPDPSVFSTPHNREGIQVGTAVALMARTPKHKGPATIRFRDFWGEDKREKLFESGQQFSPRKYERVEPIHALGLAFRSMNTAVAYTTWPTLPDLFSEWFTGVKTSRDDVVVDIDREELVGRIKAYFDPDVSDDEMREISPRAVTDASRFEAIPTRRTLQKRGLVPENIVPFAYRPFDHRWLYWEQETKLLDE